MSQYQTVAVPFVQYGNRQALTAQQLVNEPWLAEFVERFPHCFEVDPMRDVLIFYPDGDAPQ